MAKDLRDGNQALVEPMVVVREGEDVQPLEVGLLRRLRVAFLPSQIEAISHAPWWECKSSRMMWRFMCWQENASI